MREIFLPNKIESEDGELYYLYIRYQPIFDDDRKDCWKWIVDYVGDHGIACQFEHLFLCCAQENAMMFLKENKFKFKKCQKMRM